MTVCAGTPPTPWDAVAVADEIALVPTRPRSGVRRDRDRDSSQALPPSPAISAAAGPPQPPKRSRIADGSRPAASVPMGLAAAGLLALAESPPAVPTPAEQLASRAERARARAQQAACDDAGAALRSPAPPVPRFDSVNPYAEGTLKSACWTVLEPAGAGGLATAAIVAAVSAGGLVSWSVARTPVNSVTAALGQEPQSFVRVAPCTYALRKALPGAGTPRPRASPPQEPAPAAVVEQPPQAPAWPATLTAMSLNELRDAFEAVCGRRTKSKNKQWLRSRLHERGFTGGGSTDGDELTSAPAECADEAAAAPPPPQQPPTC